MLFKTFSLIGLLATSCVSGRQINADGLALIKQFEGFKPKFYLDAVGIKTIGYGHACHTSTAHCEAIHEPLTEAQATDLLIKDLAIFDSCVSKVGQLDDNQYAALISFAYNLGCSSLETSTLATKAKAKDFKGASAEFAKWTHAGGKVLPGLVTRREAERKLFCKSVGC